jgi:hypothetical protein
MELHISMSSRICLFPFHLKFQKLDVKFMAIGGLRLIMGSVSAPIIKIWFMLT